MIDTIIVVMPLMLSPGPANLVSFVLATRNDALKLLPFLLGILLIYGVIAISLGYVSSRIYAYSPSAVLALQMIGGAFIVYLGIQLARRTQQGDTDRTPTFFNGVTLQCLNPKFPGVVFAVFANRHAEPVLSVAAGIFLVGAVGLIAYSTAGAMVRTRGMSKGRFRSFDLLAGLLLCMVGLWFILEPLLSAADKF